MSIASTEHARCTLALIERVRVEHWHEERVRGEHSGQCGGEDAHRARIVPTVRIVGARAPRCSVGRAAVGARRRVGARDLHPRARRGLPLRGQGGWLRLALRRLVLRRLVEGGGAARRGAHFGADEVPGEGHDEAEEKEGGHEGAYGSAKEGAEGDAAAGAAAAACCAVQAGAAAAELELPASFCDWLPVGG
eukprot:5724094-Pleurochrysis_carterae.AAC.1